MAENPEIDGMPLLTFSDPGSKNFGVANAQSTLRQMLDPTLVGTMQHKWMRKHCNIKPEIFWSQLRARFSPPLEAIMQEGIQNNWFNSHNYIELLVFRWVWMPLIQHDLDVFAYRYNTSRKRSNTKTLLPHGRPKYIFEYPEQFDGQNFKVTVPSDMIEEVRMRYADPEHTVHDWIPVDFDNQARHAYAHYQLPPVSRTTAWHCYHTLLWYFTQIALTGEMHQELSAQGEMQRNLLAQLETGSHRGDAWAYELDGEVGFYEGENDFPVGDFSGDEADNEDKVAGGGVF
ncbi:hypothetical protein FRC07_015063 [Ceratobasidium sp. 392]|nr:hypothetical protein FRC07_015063 [Ceratobasidium sp. 392]